MGNPACAQSVPGPRGAEGSPSRAGLGFGSWGNAFFLHEAGEGRIKRWRGGAMSPRPLSGDSDAQCGCGTRGIRAANDAGDHFAEQGVYLWAIHVPQKLGKRQQ